MSRIIIGADGSERSGDAVAFGAAMAHLSGAAVTVVNAYPWQPTGFVGAHDVDHFQLEESERILGRVSEPVRHLEGFESRSVSEPSPARALHGLAEELDAELIVVGSSHHGRLGRIFPGSTAERLLHGSPCAVAVVPHGYRSSAHDGFGAIACGWDGSPESTLALATAGSLAKQGNASLRVVLTLEPPEQYAFTPDVGVDPEHALAEARAHLERALAQAMETLPGTVEATGEVLEGIADRDLIEVSESVDLMVLGSRDYGPLHAVLLGGVSAKVMRESACPVIVVPNGSGRTLSSSADAQVAALR